MLGRPTAEKSRCMVKFLRNLKKLSNERPDKIDSVTALKETEIGAPGWLS